MVTQFSQQTGRRSRQHPGQTSIRPTVNKPPCRQRRRRVERPGDDRCTQWVVLGGEANHRPIRPGHDHGARDPRQQRVLDGGFAPHQGQDVRMAGPTDRQGKRRVVAYFNANVLPGAEASRGGRAFRSKSPRCSPSLARPLRSLIWGRRIFGDDRLRNSLRQPRVSPRLRVQICSWSGNNRARSAGGLGSIGGST